MCSIPRTSFDRDGKGWKDHICNDHDPFNYLAFLYYLWKKDQLDFTGMESYVLDKVAMDDAGFLPVGRAMALTKTDMRAKAKAAAQDDALKSANSFLADITNRIDLQDVKTAALQESLEQVLTLLNTLNQRTIEHALADNLDSHVGARLSELAQEPRALGGGKA